MALNEPDQTQGEEYMFPASFAQQRLWFVEQLLPGNTLYTIPLVLRLAGSLQRSHLQLALQAIVQRHEILRTRFETVNGDLVQVVASSWTLKLPAIDLRGLPAPEREQTARKQITQAMQTPFDLWQGPLFRVQLWQLDEDEHWLLLAFHHIIFDEWSTGVLIRELGEIYGAIAQNQPASLPQLSVQYADFAHWQRQWLQDEVLHKQLHYWKQQLKDVAQLQLPSGVAAASTGHEGASQLFELSPQLLAALEKLSQQAEATLFMTLLAAFQTLLHRYTGQTDLAIGSPIANRHYSELENLIGFFVNSLVLRTDLTGDPTFRQLLHRVQNVTLAAYAHQDVPFEKLVEELQPVRNLGQNPLFQVVFALQNTPMEQLVLSDLVLSPVELESKTSRFNLELYLWKSGDTFRHLWGKGWQYSDGLRGLIVYNTDLFEPPAITALLHQFQTLLEEIVANPDCPLSALPLLTEEEQRSLLQHWSHHHSPYPVNTGVHQLFEAQAQQRPTAIAVKFGDHQFTYADLNRGSNQLARYLRKLGVNSATPVGICLERGIEAIAVMLAVLKAGAAYIPLDPGFPAERLQAMMLDADIPVVVTQSPWVEIFQAGKTICLEREWDAIAEESDDNLNLPCNTDQLAYVMYTSGSTGTPKGVMVPHRAITRLVCDTDYIQITPADCMAQVATLAFDAATFEVWGALLNGAKLVGIERDTVLSPSALASALRQEGVSILFLTTALLHQTVAQIPTAFQPLRVLLFGGEQANVDRIRLLLQQGKPHHLIHVYGPTENTTFSTWYEVKDIVDHAITIPIGTAIANTQVYLLDDHLKPVPAEAWGEIYLGGDGLAQGYLNRPDLTEERFIQCELPTQEVIRLYQTGDRALYRLDGNLEFLGRTDSQVKLRGFRVELGEIERVITRHSAVKAAVVVLREMSHYPAEAGPSERQLVAYVVPQTSAHLTERELRLFLKPKLPAYMIPAAFVVLEALPLTPNGKLDQSALPSPYLLTTGTEAPLIAPTNSLEESLLELWTQLLGRKQISINDNFFELGGHSLLATQLVSRIHDRYQVELPLRTVFEQPTIAELAQALTTLQQSAKITTRLPQILTAQPESNRPKDNVFPLSFAQQRLWFLSQLAPHNPFYNVPAAIRLTGNLNQTLLERSFQQIVARHATLRTQFAVRDGVPVQIVESQSQFKLTIVELTSVANRDRHQICQQLAFTEAQRPFNLTTDPLLRVTLLQFEPTESVLLLTLHHIVADGWSLGVLMQELAECYCAFAEAREPRLPALPMQYTEFAGWQQSWLQGALLDKQLTYWRHQLNNLPVLVLPSDRPRPAVQSYRGATYPLELSPSLTQALEHFSQQSGVSLFMTLLAAFQTLLYRYTGQTDIAVGSPIANRHHTQVEGLIGFFVNTLVIRSQISDNLTFRELLEQVKQVALAAYEHQDLPFEKLVEELDPDRNLSHNPLFQVAFALQNAPMQPLDLPGLSLRPLPLESGSTRFDLEVHLWEPTHGLRSVWQSQEGLSGFISYSTDLFDRDRIARLVGHFQTLLEGVVAAPKARLSELPLLTPSEIQHLIEQSNSPRVEAQATGFHHLFEAQAAQTPDAIAVVFEQETLTYAELNQRADHLAQLLQQLGVVTDTLVGLCVDRSAEMVITILAIFKAGGAYVPLDPTYPSDRLQFMIADTQLSILLTQSWLSPKLPPFPGKILYLDHLPNPLPPSPPLLSASPSSLAYVIYTSGSTGTPKGVLLTHRGLRNTVAAQRQVFQTSPQSRILQFSALSFDASIFEIALAFGCGGTLYIPPPPARLPGMELTQFLQDKAITHALLTPAVLAVLPDAPLPHLQVLITGGEACSSQVIDRWAAGRRFFNAYGPTEATIWATVAELHPGENPQSIGQPILNTQVYILDEHLNYLPAGIPGELYICGIGLAQGYLNQPELTAERFIEFNLPDGTLTRLYRTGDRACYHKDGRIEFLGRVDHQIKIRGFRVELGEIEATIQRYPAVQEAIVLATEAASYETRLTAYFTLNLQYFQDQVQAALQAEQIQHWQRLYDETYKPTGFTPLLNTFNITGWNSSYTGEPIPPEEMQEWVSDRVQQILALNPKRVLEIGCGTGLLLFQIAPHCEQYVATDFSNVALDSLQAQLEPLQLSHVQLLHRLATDFESIDLAAFDVVILNSIIQYFPSADYLSQVIAGALQRLATGGILFLGDIRSLPLLSAFHAWMQFCQADGGLEKTQLLQQVNRSLFEEPELAIDPAFFKALPRRFAQIQRLQIRLPRGRGQNEMSQFRYNVLLQVADAENIPDMPSGKPIELDWSAYPVTPKAAQQLLIETEPELLIIKNITNRRVHNATQVRNWLNSQDSPKTRGCMGDRLQDSVDSSLDPQDWWDLETALPYCIEITWSNHSQTGEYDVQFIRRDIQAWPPYLAEPSPSESIPFTNDPLQSQFARQLIPELRQFLKQTLPDYMVPSTFIPLPLLPLTVNGKVDRKALPLEHLKVQPPTQTYISGDSTESALMAIWQKLLRLKQVQSHDNFFELGGHSLLATQMTSRIRDLLGVELPLKSVFEAPTIAQLVPILDNLQQSTSRQQVPPLVKLERSAFRRTQPTPQPLSIPSTSPIQANDKLPSASRSALVPLTIDNRKSPFFCVHPMFGVVFPYLELAQQLTGTGRSFYGLQPLGLDGKSLPLDRIEAMAAYYIQAMQTQQPRGPYYLGGWSFGGLVAYEMAQQLTQAGQEVSLLAILDTPAPTTKLSLWQSLKYLFRTALWSTVPFLLDYGALAGDRWQFGRPWLSRWQWSQVLRSIPEESRLQLLDESAISPLLKIVYANTRAAQLYVARPYSGQLTLFRANEPSNLSELSPTLGWDTLAQEIRLHSVDGNHLSLLKQPYVHHLAQQMRHYLS